MRLRAAFAALLLAAGCAGAPAPLPDGPPAAYVPVGEGVAARFAPVFVPTRPDRPHNRIGTPAATATDDGDVRIGIDTARPAVFFRERPFTTARGTYTNLIYRVHFTRVPYRFRPGNVSAGRNVGLLAVVTLDAAGRPVLVTTVHTCGCYLAFLPTAHLQPDMYPAGWDPAGQRVWGEDLPGRLEPPEGDAAHPVLWLRDGTHRVTGAALMSGREVGEAFAPRPAPLRPIADLDRLPLPDGGTTSLFESKGRRAGYVKGSVKPLEMVFVSWWAWDLYVGSDKRYGPAEAMAKPFYTSLKPWRRKASDMWPFADFLAYWGWRL